jgi:ParB-like chromosome segregation protein Spo0J
MGQGILLQQESEPLAISAIGERFQGLRIVDPSAERTILNSMRQYGQLTPVVICRLEAGQDELLDGF